jgi:hypothetical protein
VLETNLQTNSLEMRLTAEPLIDHHRQSVLVAHRQRTATDLLRSHVIG